MEDNRQLSVVVATRNRPEGLRALVQSVLENGYNRFELIVVDQSDAPSALPEDPRLRYLHRPGTVGKSRAVNEGIRAASGTLFAFTDDDCTVPSTWLRAGVRVLDRHPEVGLVFGALEACAHDPTQMFIPEFRPPEFRVLRGLRNVHIRGGAGANMFARRELFEAVGPFDEQIGPGERYRSCEEFDMYYRALRGGFSVARDPANAVTHWGARPYADGSGQALLRWYYYGEGVVLAKHLRCGDPNALRAIAWIGAGQSRDTIRAMVSRRKLTGLGRSAFWLRGLAAGLPTRVRRRERLFG
jgi:GT2 family glycosyltransferase